MCGIFGYVGPKKGVGVVLKGLTRLEYRGYDSAGIAGLRKGELFYCKEVGKLNVLEKEIHEAGLDDLNTVIGHTRWATHGVPSKINAHPQFDTTHSLAIVHNGIIENHEILRRPLEKKGIKFVSETDTEVVAHLIASLYKGDLSKAVQQAVAMLEGTFAIAVIHRDHPNVIVASANQSPIVIGIGNQEAFIASDSHAFAEYTREVIYLTHSEIAVMTPNKIEVFNASMEQVNKDHTLIHVQTEDLSKGKFEHHTLKEIYQQPQTIRNAMANRLLDEYGSAGFDDALLNTNELMAIERIQIVACGTSWHAGLIGSLMLEDLARIPTRVEIASEFRYRNPIVLPGTLIIAISQSGETADTIAAVREVKAKSAHVLAICNMQNSTIVRESDSCIFLRAGQEVGVCSTKAFTSQVVVLFLFSVLMARMRHMTKKDGHALLNALQALPNQVQKVLDLSPQIERLAKKYAQYENFFFLGRSYMYPTSLEGALKLKEISYINANGYAAGEIKHGPIALLNDQCPVVALCSNQLTFNKMASNLREVKARGAPLIVVAEENSQKDVEGFADDIIQVPTTIDELATIPTAVVSQLLAYYIAKERGADIDMPRNLAKSVTVE